MFSKRKVQGYSAVLAGLGRAIARKAKTTGRTTTTTKSLNPTKYGKKRRTTGRTITKRKNQRETDVPSAEYTRQSVSLGLNKPRNVSISKMVKDNINKTVYSYRNYSQFAGISGNMGLNNVSTTPTTGTLEVPLHLFEITSAPNLINGTIQTPNIWWAPRFSSPLSSGALTWQQYASGLGLEQGDFPSSYTQNIPSGSSVMNWFKAKLLFYAPTTIPSRFQIDIVQFKDTRLVPDTANTSNFARSFYQAMVKRFAFSPLEEGANKYHKYLKVLYSNSFILNPKETTESVNTIYRQVDIFMRLNRRCTYDWEDQDGMNVLGVDGQVNQDQNLKNQVHPRARIFLLIRAQARNGTAYDPTIHPSYEMVLKTSHSQLNA